jgi:hypothetical protein
MPDPVEAGFWLPGVDDPPSTETGVILMGLTTVQLLAGLGVAALADDPAAVTLLVDHVRHGDLTALTMDQLATAGVRRWQSVREALAGVGFPGSGSASLRQEWARAYRALGRCQTGEMGPASAVYLTACWLRGAEIDRYTQAVG